MPASVGKFYLIFYAIIRILEKNLEESNGQKQGEQNEKEGIGKNQKSSIDPSDSQKPSTHFNDIFSKPSQIVNLEILLPLFFFLKYEIPKFDTISLITYQSKNQLKAQNISPKYDSRTSMPNLESDTVK